MILNLSKGQEALKELLFRKKKKAKKSIGVINLGRRFKGSVKQIKEDGELDSKYESDKYDEDNNHDIEHYKDEEDYQDPPGDERYRFLEERLMAMEIQKVTGLDFENLGLVSGVFIPPKFKVPAFSQYDGVSCPKMHLKAYV